MRIPEGIQVIAFDADDTLWDNQTAFDKVQVLLEQVLSPWATAREVSVAMLDTERRNMPSLGFGIKAFTLSLIETALRVSHGEVSATGIQRLLDAGKQMLDMPCTPLPGVEKALRALSGMPQYRLVLFTKGDTLEQQDKVNRSGLSHYFQQVVIVADKTEEQYAALCRQQGISPSSLLMVGNSFKSDIMPVVHLGGWGVHIPFYTIWSLEQVEEFPHPHIIRLQRIDELCCSQ